MSAARISVIVPIYNVAPYVRRCLDSICAQTFADLEILLIDDGSTDESGNICEEYAKKDGRIRVVHQENQGLSSARNKGLELSSCDLVGFVDGDDWIEPDMYQILYQNLCATDADIATCAHDRAGDPKPPATVVYDQQGAMIAALQDQTVYVYAWNKLYKKDLFRSVRYPVGMFYEDMYVILDILGSAQRTVSTNAIKYHYTQRQGSITAMVYHPKEEDRIISAEKNLELAKSKYPGLMRAAKTQYINAHHICLKKILASDPEKYAAKLKEHRRVLLKNAGFILFRWPRSRSFKKIWQYARKAVFPAKNTTAK